MDAAMTDTAPELRKQSIVTATMTAADGALHSEAGGLIVLLLPHQP
jgi:hypothetical protein